MSLSADMRQLVTLRKYLYMPQPSGSKFSGGGNSLLCICTLPKGPGPSYFIAQKHCWVYSEVYVCSYRCLVVCVTTAWEPEYIDGRQKVY